MRLVKYGGGIILKAAQLRRSIDIRINFPVKSVRSSLASLVNGRLMDVYLLSLSIVGIINENVCLPLGSTFAVTTIH